MGEGSRVQRRGVREGWKGASDFDDVQSFLCVEEESALVVVVQVFARKMDVIRVCAGKGWERRNREAKFWRVVRGVEMGKACACGKKTDVRWAKPCGQHR